MANYQYRIVHERDHTYTVEIAQGAVMRTVEHGFRTAMDAEIWAEHQQAASMGMDKWERMPDGDRP